MTTPSKILGYFLFDYTSSDNGFAATSLEDLVNEGHEDKLPFLDKNKLKQLQSPKGINVNEIDAIPNSTQGKRGGSATSGFLYKMHETGRGSEIGLPKDKVFITTNRKTIQKILQLFHDDEPGELLIKTKLRAREYGKELRVQYNNKKDQQLYWDKIAVNGLFGLKFNSFLVNDEGKSGDELKSALISIHRFDIGDTCIVYEAEIDALQRFSGSDSGISIAEVKTYNQEDKAVAAFNQYTEIYQKMYESNQCANGKQNLRAREKFVKTNPKFFNPLLQGELGNVSKYIYGMIGNRRITVKEFPCYPGVIMQHELQYLREFVDLLNRYDACSFDNGLTWDDCCEWRVTKDKHIMKLWHKNVI